MSIFLQRSGLLSSSAGQAGGGGGAFNPADVFGVSDDGFYISAIDSTMYQTTSKLTLADADADPIGWVEDLSGNANPATSSSTARPRVELDGAVPQINFDSDGRLLELPSDLSCTGSQNRTFACFLSSPSSESTIFGLNHEGASAESWRVRIASGKLRVEITGAGYTSSLSFSSTGTHFICVVLDGTTLADHTLYVGSSSEGATGTTTLATGTGTNEIGEPPSGGVNFVGNIVEALFINRALTSTEIADVRSYMEALI